MLGSEERQGPLPRVLGLHLPVVDPSLAGVIGDGWAWNLLEVGVRLPSCGGHHVGDLQGAKQQLLDCISTYERHSE